MSSFFKGIGKQVSESSATVKKELVEEKKNITNQVQTAVASGKSEIESKVTLLLDKLAEKENQLNSLKAELANRDDLATRIEQTIQAIIADDIEKDKQIELLKKEVVQKKVEFDILKDQMLKLSNSVGKQMNNTEQQKLIQSLTQQNNDLKQKLASASSTPAIDDELFQQVKEAMEERDSLTQKLKDAELANIQLQSQIVNFRTLQEQWMDTQKTLQQKIYQLQASNDAEKIKQLEGQIEEYKRSENALNFRITELKNQLEDPKLGKAIAEMEEKCQALTKQTESLTLEIEQKDALLSNKEDEVSRLIEFKSSFENREKQLLDQISQLKSVVTAFESTSPQKSEEGQTEAEEAPESIGNEWKSKYDELLKQYSRLLLERTSFNEKLQATDQQIIELESRVNRLSEDLRKSQERERSLGDSNSKLKEKIGELDSSLRQAEIKLHSFHEQTIELQSTKIHMEDLSQQNSHLQTEKSSLEEKLQHVEQAFAQTSKDLQEAKDKVKEYETSHVPSHEVDELLAKVRELETKLVDQQFSFPVPETSLDDQKKIQDLSEELLRLRQENQDLRDQHTIFKERIESLKKREQDAVQSVQSGGDELKKTIKTLEAEKEENVARFLSQINRLSSQVADLQTMGNKHVSELQTVKSCLVKLVETRDAEKVLPMLSSILRLSPEEQAIISKIKGKKKK